MYNSIYPINIKPYVPPYVNGKNKDGVKDKEEQERNSSNSHNAESNNATDPNGRNGRYVPQEFPNGQKTTIDYSKSKVNIAQILTDFKSTAVAIGSPPNIINEVEQYLSIAETESLKNEPNKKRIQTTLKNASNVLDEFISKTLNKKSKVVENWIDALFLQKVDYKSDPNTVNPDFLVKLPDKETGDMKPISKDLSAKVQPETSQPEDSFEAKNATEAVSIQETGAVQTSQNPTVSGAIAQNEPAQEISQPQQSEIAAKTSEEVTPEAKQKKSYMPENAEIKASLIAGKRFAAANQPDKAIAAFQSALELSMMYGDNNAEGIACFEIGKIYDKNDNLDEALRYYNQAHNATNDLNLKARAYYNMAQIYDDVVYFEPAMNHYFAAISFAGEAENLNAQTKALANIGDMYADRYDVENTYVYYNLAKNIALETNNDKTKGNIWSRSADSLSFVSENVNALSDYKTSTKFYEKTDLPLKMAENYEKAAEIMQKLGNTNKAQSLMQKAEKLVQKASQDEFNKEIERRLAD